MMKVEITDCTQKQTFKNIYSDIFTEYKTCRDSFKLFGDNFIEISRFIFCYNKETVINFSSYDSPTP